MPQTGHDWFSETSLDPQALQMPFPGPVTLPQRERKSRIIPSLSFLAGSGSIVISIIGDSGINDLYFHNEIIYINFSGVNNNYSNYFSPPELFSFSAVSEKKKLRKKEISSLRSSRPCGGAEL
jgi:hypothetical protein